MSLLKKFGIGIASLFVLFLVTASIVKKEYSVMRSVTINKPKHIVFEYIRHLKNQDEYSKWATMDPLTKHTYTGKDGNVGFVAAWESNNPDVGVGEQEITKIDDNHQIDFELRFKEPFESKAPAFMSTEALSENTTKVSWGFTGRMDYPMNILLICMDIEKTIGDDFQTGLDNLKRILEAE